MDNNPTFSFNRDPEEFAAMDVAVVIKLDRQTLAGSASGLTFPEMVGQRALQRAPRQRPPKKSIDIATHILAASDQPSVGARSRLNEATR